MPPKLNTTLPIALVFLAVYSKHFTHTYTIVLWLFWISSGTTRVSQYQKVKTRKVKPLWIYWSKRQ